MTAIRKTFEHIRALDFNLIRTPLVSAKEQIDSPIKDKGIVFTGKMQIDNRTKGNVQIGLNASD